MRKEGVVGNRMRNLMLAEVLRQISMLMDSQLSMTLNYRKSEVDRSSVKQELLISLPHRNGRNGQAASRYLLKMVT